ncbi:DNA-processing protein DprA [Actinopolymorpha pittospori]|uniref:DNA-processing protein DprA n=1 Tax=Actinopolymorpha pittospori TaxID=648752 RepID=UPI00178AE943
MSPSFAHRKKIPSPLADSPGRPWWLFVEGNPEALYQSPRVAVVGTRQPSPSGVKATEAVVRTMAAYRITLVSGLANGVDVNDRWASSDEDHLDAVKSDGSYRKVNRLAPSYYRLGARRSLLVHLSLRRRRLRPIRTDLLLRRACSTREWGGSRPRPDAGRG